MTTGRIPSVDGGIQPTIIDAAGDLIYGASNDTPARLAIGTAGQVLRVNSGATAPEWFTPAAAGGMTLINTGGTTLSGSTTTISSIPTTYRKLFILLQNVRNTTGATPANVRFNTDTTTKYFSRAYQSTDAENIYAAGTSQIQMYNNMNDAAPGNVVVIELDNYTSTDYKMGTIRSIGDSDINTGTYGFIYHRTIGYFGSAAITSVTFHTTDSFQAGTAFIYGVS